nr:NUDIX hydrolase [uncultured Carboxylicivirga sp.]
MTYHRPFNLRIYGLLVNSFNEVLLTDEYRMNMFMSKFPGGGLEYGEGTIECLKREFWEELNLDIEITSHFYTTDYFQKALFFEDVQLISIYYLIKADKWQNIKTTSKVYDIQPTEGAQSFRWVSIDQLKPEDLTFPIDQKVAQMLKQL